jgi:DNA-binding FrmR family transcriptional regulator
MQKDNNEASSSKTRKMIKKASSKKINVNHCHNDEIEDEAIVPGKKGHPNHTSALARLRKIKGQIGGLEKMIENRRYCVDILIQFKAITSGLNVIEASIFKRHIESCVREAAQSNDKEDIQNKLDELIKLIKKRL